MLNWKKMIGKELSFWRRSMKQGHPKEEALVALDDRLGGTNLVIGQM